MILRHLAGRMSSERRRSTAGCKEENDNLQKSEPLKYKKLILLWLAASLLTADQGLSRETRSYPQAKEPLIIQRVLGPVTLDGLSNEDAWKDIKPLPLIMFLPNYGNPPSEKTEILIGFDDVHLYVAARLYDREPAKIQAPSKKRDYFESNTEWVGVLFDTFNDKENALGFFTTPSGLRWDGTVSNDAEQKTIKAGSSRCGSLFPVCVSRTGKAESSWA